MLVLGSVAAGNVGKRRVRVNKLGVDQLLEGTNVSGVVLFEPFAAKSKSSVVLFNGVEERLSLVLTEDRLVGRVEVEHIVTTIDIVVDKTFSSGAESLNGKLLAFLHACSVSVLDNGH